MIVKPVRTRLFKQGEKLEAFLQAQLPRLREGTVVVVTSKIVALAQGRVVSFRNPAEKDRWIKKESRLAVRTPWCWLTWKNGEWCANAGVDESNADGRLILLPRNIQKTAEELLRWFKRTYRLKKLGVIISDTRIYPMRAGTMGVALGFAGFQPIKSYIGTQDLFGRKLRHTEMNVVNALAVAAVLVMGEGNEQQPIAVVEDAPVHFAKNTVKPSALAIDPCDDLYRLAYETCRTKRHKHSKRRRPGKKSNPSVHPTVV